MTGLVAYYTKYGNGRIICEAMATGIEEEGHQVMINVVGEADSGGNYDFLIVSSPTRFGRMIGPVKRFVAKTVRMDRWKGKPFVAVGTGTHPKERGEKSDADGAESAEKLHDALEKGGLKPLLGPQKFFVADWKGPLEDGEEARARELGRTIGRELEKA